MTEEFGEYRLIRLMGEGGMAQVWSALRQTWGGPMRCAVKVIKPSHADAPRYREMFQREARLSLALSGHGNVVSVFDVGEHEGRSYLAMELIEGVTLGELARRVGKPWQVAHAVYVVAGVLRALCHIHGHTVEGVPQGIVHRDVTPHNVMISARGEIKLMDFGIAQRADAEPCLGGALGKLAYVPREQVEGEPDQRSDLYAAGALLYELLDGRRFRWHCADEDAYFLEIYRDRVPTLSRKDVPPQVAAVLRGLLQPDRERRIATAAEALRQLEAWSGFRWAFSELEAIYGAVIGGAAQEAAPALDDAAPARSRGAARGHRPWDDSSPSAANDSGRSHRAVTVPQADSQLEASGPVVRAAGPSARVSVPAPRASGPSPRASGPSPRASGPSPRASGPSPRASGPSPRALGTTHEHDAAVPSRRRRTVSVPVWADGDEPSGVAITEELPAPDEMATRLLPAAERNPELAAEPMERLVTRRHPTALPEQDVPSARISAEIAVTMPQPSRLAPWAAGTDPIASRLVQPEPGAPQRRRRAPDSTDSVAPRQRESAAVHRAASGATHMPGVVAGEIVTDDDLEPKDVPVWRVGSR